MPEPTKAEREVLPIVERPYYPAVYEGTTPVEPEKTPEEGYHFTEDMTDKAISAAPD